MLFLSDCSFPLNLFASTPSTSFPAAQTFLPSLGDVITTPVTQVTVSADGIVGAFDQTQWPSLHTNKPTVQLQTKKRGQSLSIRRSQVNYALSNCIICLTLEPISFFNHAGRKPRHRRAESPTPDIIVKKDKYNKGTFICCLYFGPWQRCTFLDLLA